MKYAKLIHACPVQKGRNPPPSKKKVIFFYGCTQTRTIGRPTLTRKCLIFSGKGRGHYGLFGGLRLAHQPILMWNHILPVGPTCDEWSLFGCAQVASGSNAPKFQVAHMISKNMCLCFEYELVAALKYEVTASGMSFLWFSHSKLMLMLINKDLG